MRAITHSLLESCMIPPGPIADIGCGGGHMVEELSAAYPCRRIYGVDLNAYALAHSALNHCDVGFAQADLSDLPFADGDLALLLALDAYDQDDVDLAYALAESLRVIRPGGLILLRVSAKPWLKGPHDAAFHTGRRYESHEIFGALEDAGFTPERITFANMLLSLPQGALRLLQRWRIVPLYPALYTARVVNVSLGLALSLEARWLRRRDLPGGLSLYAIARKT